MSAVQGFVREVGPDDAWARRQSTPRGFRRVIVDELVRPDASMWQRLDRPRRCRFTVGPKHETCGRPAVIAIMRGSARKSQWGYCEGHLYGRRWENGRLLVIVLVPEDAS